MATAEDISSGVEATTSLDIIVPGLLLQDTFTGAEDSDVSVSKWTTGYTGTGASAKTKSNKGRWQTGTAGGYAGTARISRKAIISPAADVEVRGFYTPQGETYPEIYIRSSDTVFDTSNGYVLRLPTPGATQEILIYRVISYSGLDLAEKAFSVSNGVAYGFRFRVIGTSLKARIWVATDAEPSAWDLEVTNSSITAAGNVGLSVGAGAAASTYVDFDNIVITEALATTDVSASDSSVGSDSVGYLLASVSASDTGAGADNPGDQSRGASDTALGLELAEVGATPASSTESVESVETVTLEVTVSASDHVHGIESVLVEVPPVEIFDYDLSTGLDLDRRIGTGPYRFRLPWTEGPRADHRFFRRISVHRGLTLLHIDGTYRLIEDPTAEDFTAADIIYLGGYDHWVTDDEAQELGNAGYAEYIEGFVYIPDAYYGSGQYGVSPYGN